MKTVNLKQNTPEWEEFRRSMLGASDIAIIMTGSESDKYKLYQRKISGEKGYVTPAMQRGHDLEPDARSFYELTSGKDFPAEVGVHEEYDWLMASLDGFNRENGEILEIKCPLEVPDTAQNAKDWEKYYWQIQAQLCVSGCDTCNLLIFSPEKQTWCVIERNDSDILKILKEGEKFYKYIRNQEDYPVPIEERFDNEWAETMDRYIKALIEEKEAGGRVVLEKEKLIKLSGNKSCRGNGATLAREEVLGAVDYSKIPQLQGVDLKVYRKPSFVRWTVRLDRN